MIAIADSWEGRSGSSDVNITVSGFEEGDLIVVLSFAFGGSGSPTTPLDDGSNVYTVRTQTTPDGTFDSVVAIADAIVDTVPTEVWVSNSAGGANDVGIVVLRVTHDGSAWTSPSYVLAGTDPADDPLTGAVTVGATTPEPFANNGAVLWLGGLTHDGATTTFTAGTGWATVEEDEDASGVPYSVVSKVETSSGPQTHQWQTGAARDYAYVLAAYTELIPDPVLQLVVTPPVPSVTGLGLEVSNPDKFPDPDLRTFHILTHPAEDGLFVPTLQNAELLRVVSWNAISLPPVDWDIERAQAGSQTQNIEVGWWVWWDHLFGPLELLDYVASYQLTAVAGGIGGVVGDIEDIEEDIDNIGSDVDAVESDVDAVEALVDQLRLVARTVYTSGSGTHTYDTETASVRAIVCGGGGDGGAADGPGVGTATAGGGGGGGGVSQKMFLKGTDAGCTYTVGAAGGNSDVDPGAAASIVGNAGSPGAAGAASPGAAAGGAGGTATGGDMNSAGQAGSSGINIGSAQAMAGGGGSSVMGGGGVGRIILAAPSGNNGGAGGNYGGGGGGAAAGLTGGSRTGGAGGAGIVIIEEYGIGV